MTETLRLLPDPSPEALAWQMLAHAEAEGADLWETLADQIVRSGLAESVAIATQMPAPGWIIHAGPWRPTPDTLPPKLPERCDLLLADVAEPASFRPDGTIDHAIMVVTHRQASRTFWLLADSFAPADTTLIVRLIEGIADGDDPRCVVGYGADGIPVVREVNAAFCRRTGLAAWPGTPLSGVSPRFLQMGMRNPLTVTVEGWPQSFHLFACPVVGDPEPLVALVPAPCWGASPTHATRIATPQPRVDHQHHVRNMLAVVRSIARRTRSSDGEAWGHLDGRLNAFTRIQALMTYGTDDAIDLHAIIDDELRVQPGDRVTVSGPKVSLPPRIAERLGLAIHELTTNAVKFGAMGQPGGKLSVRWTAGEMLTLYWQESVIDPLPPRGPPGFGTELIEELLPYELQAECMLDLHSHGLTCTIAIKLPHSAQAGNAR